MEIINPIIDHELWDHLISAHSNATVFHTSAWAKVLNKTYNHRPFYLQLKNKNEKTSLLPIMEVNSPILGRRGVCLPFSDLCRPLYRNDADLIVIKDFVENLAAKRKWKYFELRDDAFSVPDSTTSEEPVAPTFLSHELDLSIGCERLFANFSSSTRRALRKSEKSQLEVRIECTENAMQNFFKLHTLTRRRHGLPPQPYRFFHNIHKELIDKGLGFVVSAFQKKKDQPIAASVFLNYEKRAIYKFGASDEKEWNLRPNNLVMWESIKHLIETGNERLHFGRTIPNQDGLRRFKLSWGVEEKIIKYIQFTCRYRIWKTASLSMNPGKISKIAAYAFGHAPVKFNRTVGAQIYPHLD